MKSLLMAASLLAVVCAALAQLVGVLAPQTTLVVIALAVSLLFGLAAREM